MASVVQSAGLAGRRRAWCLAKSAEFAALKQVKIYRLLTKEDESVVRMAERMQGKLSSSSFDTRQSVHPVGDGRQGARRGDARGGSGSSASLRGQRKAEKLRRKWLERNGSWQKLRRAVLLGVHLRRWVERFRARRAAAHDAHSATGTGERHCRPARRAGTGHCASRRLALAGTGALECQPSAGTGQNWASSASSCGDTGHCSANKKRRKATKSVLVPSFLLKIALKSTLEPFPERLHPF